MMYEELQYNIQDNSRISTMSHPCVAGAQESKISPCSPSLLSRVGVSSSVLDEVNASTYHSG